MATGMTSPEAKSNGKLWALRSCMTSIPKSSRLIMSAQVLMTRPSESMTAWLKLNPLRLKAMVDQGQVTGRGRSGGHENCCVMDDETSKVSVGGNNVVGFFLLSELVSIVGGYVL